MNDATDSLIPLDPIWSNEVPVDDKGLIWKDKDVFVNLFQCSYRYRLAARLYGDPDQRFQVASPEI